MKGNRWVGLGLRLGVGLGLGESCDAKNIMVSAYHVMVMCVVKEYHS